MRSGYARPLVSMLWLLLVGCVGSLPETHYYQLAVSSEAHASEGQAEFSVAPLVVDAAYDEPRIVYRTGPYQLDYYHYHRWSSSPSLQLRDYLREALARTGSFRKVGTMARPTDHVVLTGRVSALEEVDQSEEQWVGRIVLELHLRDAQTGELLWSRRFEQHEPLPVRHPRGLAEALSLALERIVREIAPRLAQLSNEAAARQQRVPPELLPGAEEQGDASLSPRELP